MTKRLAVGAALAAVMLVGSSRDVAAGPHGHAGAIVGGIIAGTLLGYVLAHAHGDHAHHYQRPPASCHCHVGAPFRHDRHYSSGPHRFHPPPRGTSARGGYVPNGYGYRPGEYRPGPERSGRDAVRPHDGRDLAYTYPAASQGVSHRGVAVPARRIPARTASRPRP